MVIMPETELLEFYKICENYFTEELGFKPFRQAPKFISIIDENTKKPEKVYSKWKKLETDQIDTELIIAKSNQFLAKALIAVESLSSFFVRSIGENPLLKAFAYYRLIHGKSPLKKSMINQLRKYYLQIQGYLEQEIAKDQLLQANFRAISLLLPETRIEESFKKHIYDFANLEPFFAEENTGLIDSVLTDNWFSDVEKGKITKDEMSLFIEASKLFSQTSQPFSIDFLMKKIKRKFQKDKSKNKDVLPRYYTDTEEIERIYKDFGETTVGFAYLLDFGKMGLDSYHYIIQIYPKFLDLMNYCFENLKCSSYFKDNFSQKNLVVRIGRLRLSVQDHMEVINFFNFLKNIGIISEFLLIRYAKYRFFNNNIILAEEVSYYEQIKDRKKIKTNELFLKFGEKDIDINLDILDYVLIDQLIHLGISGFGLAIKDERMDIFLTKLNNELNSHKAKLREINNVNAALNNISGLLQIEEDFSYLYPLNLIGSNQEIPININEIISFIIKKFGFLNAKIYVKSLLGFYTTVSEQVNLDFLEILMSVSTEIKSEKAYFMKKFGKLKSASSKRIEILMIINSLNSYFNVTSSLQVKFQETTRKNLQNNIKILEDYLQKPIELKKKEFNEKINHFLQKNLIYPYMQATLWDTRHYSLKTIYLKKVDIGDNRLEILAKFFAYIHIIGGKDCINNSGYVIIEIINNSSFNKILSDIIRFLFPSELVFLGGFLEPSSSYRAMGILMQVFEFYNYDSKTFSSLRENFEHIKEYLENSKDKYEIIKKQKTNFMTGFEEKFEYSNPKQMINKIFYYIHKNAPKKKKYKEKRGFKDIVDFSFSKNRNKNFIDITSDLDKNIVKNLVSLPNFEMFGFNKYILQLKINKPTFAVKIKKTEEEESSQEEEPFEPEIKQIHTSEFLLCPGSTKIESSADLGFFQNIFIHYVFPKDEPHNSILKYAENRSLISVVRLMKITKVKLNFNPLYFLGSSQWKTSFNTWDKLVEKVLKRPEYQFEPNFLNFDLTTNKDIILGEKSDEFKTVSTIYNRNLKQFYSLKMKDKIDDLIKINAISPYPVLNFEYLGLNEKIIVFFGDLKDEQEKVLLMIFSMLPCGKFYNVIYSESYKNKLIKGLLIELHLPNSLINQLCNTISKIKTHLKLGNFQFIPNINEIPPVDFTHGKIKEHVNPFLSHTWSRGKWKKIKYFDIKGQPLSHKEKK